MKQYQKEQEQVGACRWRAAAAQACDRGHFCSMFRERRRPDDAHMARNKACCSTAGERFAAHLAARSAASACAAVTAGVPCAAASACRTVQPPGLRRRPGGAQIASMKDYVARFGHGSAKLARQAQSKEKVLAKMVRGGLTERVKADHVVRRRPSAPTSAQQLSILSAKLHHYPWTAVRGAVQLAVQGGGAVLQSPPGAKPDPISAYFMATLLNTELFEQCHMHLKCTKIRCSVRRLWDPVGRVGAVVP